MFYNIESLNLVSQSFFDFCSALGINTVLFSFSASAFFNLVNSMFYAHLIATLYGQPVRFWRYLLFGLVTTVALQGIIFGVVVIRSAYTQFPVENLFVCFPAYFIIIYYFAATHVLGLNRNRCVPFVKRFYSLMMGTIVLYYIFESISYLLVTNRPEYTVIVVNLGNLGSVIVHFLIYLVMMRYIRKNKMWVNSPFQRAYSNPRGELISATIKAAIMHVLVTFIVNRLSQLSTFSIVIAGLLGLLCACIFIFLHGYNRDKVIYNQIITHDMNIHINSLLNAIESFRTVKHDINNMMMVYHGYLKTKNYGALDRYHSSVYKLVQESSDAVDINRKLRDNPAFYTLLLSKLQLASEYDVHLKISCTADARLIRVHPLDLTRMIGILLDNAVESARESQGRTVFFFLEYSGDKILASISNTTKENLDINEIIAPKPGTTSKYGHSGLGLHTLWNIVTRTPDCNLRADYANLTVTFYLELPQVEEDATELFDATTLPVWSRSIYRQNDPS